MSQTLWTSGWVGVVVLLVAAPTGLGHPVAYTNTNALTNGFIPTTASYVVFPAGHIVPNAMGEAVVWINDFLNNPSVGIYCQDLNGDSWCGGNPAILPPAPYGIDPITGARGEPSFAFCGSASIQSPLSYSYKLEEEWADPVNFGGNWDPASDVYIILRGIASGNPAYVSCGSAATSTPTTGDVVH